MENTNKKMKKGITLIEIILAIVLIAIILGITIPKLMSNSDQAEIKNAISNDVKTITEAANIWRKQTVAANGTFLDVSAGNITSLLPNTMTVVGDYIMSSGLRTGDGTNRNTAVRYFIRNNFGTGTNRGTFALGMEIVPAGAAAGAAGSTAGWDQRMMTYALNAFNDAIQSTSAGVITGGPRATQFTGAVTIGTTVNATCVGGSGYSAAATSTICFDTINVR